jgi:hypothetical protein
VFDSLIERRHGTSVPTPHSKNNTKHVHEVYEDNDEKARYMPKTNEAVDARGMAINQQPLMTH